MSAGHGQFSFSGGEIKFVDHHRCDVANIPVEPLMRFLSRIMVEWTEECDLNHEEKMRVRMGSPSWAPVTAV